MQAGDRLSTAVSTWKYLQVAPQPGFAPLANFLINHRGWPGEADARKKAEAALRVDAESPTQVAAYFAAHPPLSATAHLRHADALAALDRKDDALIAARKAWLAGSLSPEDETRFLERYTAALQAGDHDARMDTLLWARAILPATRQLGFTGPERRALFAARLGYISKAADAAQRALLVPPQQQADPGYIADRVYWLRNTGQANIARALLSNLKSPSAAPSDPMRWLDMLEGTIEGAAAEQQWSFVEGIARQVQFTYAAGVAPRDRPANERNGFTDVTWAGGMAALNKLGRPRDALWFFDQYSRAARSPQTRAKGLYWAARAAERAGDRELATSYLTQASEFFDQFHGQLATERLGKTLAFPQEHAAVEVSASERAAFAARDVVKVAQWLGRTGQWQDQTRFVRTIAASASTPADHLLGAELASKINRPDLALLTGRNAREKGYGGYARYAFPTMRVPDEHASNWTMIHAITRQESQFDREAQSRVGARGLMQLMPGTARQTAPSAGVVYDLGMLTADPLYNIRLGSTYFGQMMTNYQGSYILSVAAYNAGPGNVNKWLRANGDPRLPGVDPIAWIEAIPFTETRGYVQRVLENAAVYELINPRKVAGRPPVRLSSWLGGDATAYGSR